MMTKKILRYNITLRITNSLKTLHCAQIRRGSYKLDSCAITLLILRAVD